MLSPSTNNIASKIADMVFQLAVQRGPACASIGAIVECAVGALEPMVTNLFTGGTLQERLLFSLALVGSCSTLAELNDGAHALTVNVCPESLRESFRLYQQITGKDIKSYLPPSMVQFAGHETLN